MKALAVGLIAGAALCGVISAVPASAMPKSNLATAASDLALGQSVRYVRLTGTDRAITVAMEPAVAALHQAPPVPLATLKAACAHATNL